ncbi:MAG: glycosyltransferase [Clostridia bacterium]|nr:glycosyltransferase [Clostridia bacterium]
MLLSIGMIIKNEEQYLRQCLEALVPILEQVDSELIIADTGSTDSSVEIAKEFTNNVFHFEWCDDFAAARNSTLKKATGEWFMFIDGDEIIEDASELIEFFNSGEYKKYNSATYVVRNYSNEAMSIYSDFNAGRLVKITPETCFKKPIHELLMPFNKPYKILSVVARHFGYVFTDREFAEAKAERNINLLLDELKKTPKAPLLYLQLAEAYSVKENKGSQETAVEYCVKGLEYAKNENRALFCALYAILASCYYSLDRHSDVIKVAREYFDSKKEKMAIDVEMYVRMGFSHMELKEYSKAIIAFENYVALYELFTKGLLNTSDTLYHSINCVSPEFYRKAIYVCVNAYKELKDYKKAFLWIRKLPIGDFSGSEPDVVTRIKSELDLMCESGDFSGVVDLYRSSNEKTVLILQKLIDGLYSKNDKNAFLLLSALCDGNLLETAYVKLLKIRLADMENSADISDKINQFFKDGVSLSENYSDVLYFMIKYKFPFDTLSVSVDAFDLQSFVNSICKRFSDAPKLIFRYIEETVDIYNLKEASCACMLCEALFDFADALEEDEAVRLFSSYAEVMDHYLANVILADVLSDENIDLLPRNLRGGYFCTLALAALNDKAMSLYIEHLKSALKANPKLNKIITLLSRDLKQEVTKKAEIETEFEKYARAIKDKIANFISLRQIENARQTIAAYEQINPKDGEIVMLKKQLESLAR